MGQFIVVMVFIKYRALNIRIKLNYYAVITTYTLVLSNFMHEL